MSICRINTVVLSLSLSLSTVVTVNDYLAQRDAEWMGRVHRFLGLSVGLIQVIARESSQKKKEMKERKDNCLSICKFSSTGLSLASSLVSGSF